jgi:hypothetical protein
MSPEILQTMEPSLFKTGEGYQDWTKVNPATSGRDLNDDLSNYRHGGVRRHGMSAKVMVLMEEICAGGRYSPTAGTSGEPVRPVQASAEVGEARSSDEAGNDRGAKGPHLVDVNSEAGDW